MIGHLNIRVTGKVQGVFYRASTIEKAMALGLKGFVRNEHDGSVYIEAEGTVGQLEQLISWCKQGPPRAEVMKVTVSEGNVVGFEKFEMDR